jgi:hypothetical protein
MRNAWLLLFVLIGLMIGGWRWIEVDYSLCLKQLLDKARKRVTEKAKIYAGLEKQKGWIGVQVELLVPTL